MSESGEAVSLASERYGWEPGRGAPMLIAHGLLGAKRNWATLAGRFAEARPVASLDMRNHGESPRSPVMDYLAMGADLLRSVDDLGEGRAVLLGHSMGGKSAMSAALTRPEAIAALIVVDIAPIAYQHFEHMEIVAAMRGVDLSNVAKRSDVEPALAEAAPDPSLRAFLLQNLAFDRTPEGRVARWTPDLGAISEALPNLISWPASLDARRYEGPVLMIGGARSPYVSPEGEAAARDRFPQLTLARMETGHWPHAEKPAEFYELVTDWLGRLDV